MIGMINDWQDMVDKIEKVPKIHALRRNNARRAGESAG